MLRALLIDDEPDARANPTAGSRLRLHRTLKASEDVSPATQACDYAPRCFNWAT